MNIQERTKNRTEISKLIKEIYFKNKNIFKDLTNYEAKKIANAVNNISGLAIRKYGFNLGNISIPLLINGVENFNLNDTIGQETKYYPNAEAPFTITCREDFNPTLGTGQYIRVYTAIDNNNSVDNLFKSIPKGTLFGVYNTDAFFRASKESFGNDLQTGTPFNIEVINNTTKFPTLKVYSQFYTEYFSSITGSTITTHQWQNWNFINPQWTIDLTNETQGVKFELFHKETNLLLSNAYAYPLANYQGGNFLGQIQPSYSTNNFKIVISNL